MKQGFRSVIACFLLLIFLYNAAGYYAVFALSRHYHRSEMERTIRKNVSGNKLKVIELKKQEMNSSTSLFQMVGNNEIRYKGRLYDIVKVENSGDSVYFYCIADHKETKLFAELSGHMKQHAGDDSIPPGSEKTLKKGLDDFTFEIINPAATAAAAAAPIHSIKADYTSPVSDILSPPPRLLAA